jgi:hypothetical protein
MSREIQPFEQDFILLTDTEMRVRQATQYTQLSSALLPNPYEDIWEWDASDQRSEQPIDRHVDEQYLTVWESMLKRL